MAQGDGTVSADGVGGADPGERPATRAGASDLRLTESLRADTSAAYAALQELRARHGPSVLTYARLCASGESTARQLAAQAFTLAARETARGTDDGGPLRHRLLLLTARVAASWITDGRVGGIDAGLHLVLSSAGPDGPVAPMLTPFRTLPYRAQGLIWYGTVEREPPERTAMLLGLTREDVGYDTDSALRSLARACLRSRLAASDDPRCGDFRRLIEEAARPGTPRAGADLHAHMARCPHCTAAYEELCALRDDPRTTLAEGLLPWAGTAYTALGDLPAAPGGRSRPAAGLVPRSRRLLLASTALGVAAVPLLLSMLLPADAPPEHTAESSTTRPAPPPVTVTATASPPPTASATHRTPSPSPSRTEAPVPPPTTAHPTPPPSYPPPGAAYAQLVNLASGRCLDIDGEVEKRTDVVTARCTSAPTQRWRVDAERGVLQSYADPDYCLDSRGAVSRGVGIWECDSVDGRNGANLRFTVDNRGVIRPAVAPDHAVAASGGDDGVSLAEEAGRTNQRWRAGA